MKIAFFVQLGMTHSNQQYKMIFQSSMIKNKNKHKYNKHFQHMTPAL